MTVWELPVLCVLSVLSGIKSVCGMRLWRGELCSIFKVWTERKVYLFSLVWLAFYVLIWFGFGREAVMLRSVDMLCTYVILAAVDGKRRIVPDSILLCYFTGQMLLGAMSMHPAALLHIVLTGAFFMAAALLFTWFSKGKMGMGDAALLGVTAMTAGWRFALQILVLAFVLSFVYSIWLMAVRKKSMKTEFPFVPILAAAMAVYLMYLALG